jgi:hypothetical protein
MKIEINNSEQDIRQKFFDKLEGYKFIKNNNLNSLNPNDFIKYVHIYYPIKITEGKFDSILDNGNIRLRGTTNNFKWNIKPHNYMIFYMRNKDKNFKDLIDLVIKQENNK